MKNLLNTPKSLLAVMTVAAATGMMSGTANANFDGMYVGGGLAMNKMTVKYSYDDSFFDESFYSQNTGGDNDHSFELNLNAGYGMSFGQFNVAGEFSYATGLGEATPYSWGYSDIGGFSYNYSTKAELSNAWAISILPGYKLSNNTLIYGRLGYVGAKLKLSESYSDSNGFSDGYSDSKSVNGILYGIGMKHAFTPQLAAVLEYQATDFKKETFADGGEGFSEYAEPASNGVLLGIQYSF